jgi:TolB-like protein/class 3 adenylate cyclase/Flp pilus assembly protein TadD
MGESSVRQRLAAVLAADAAGYSRLMSLDERATVEALDAARAVFRARIESQGGRVVDMAGDSVLALFETASGAVTAALQIQEEIEAAALSQPEERRMRFRVGLHLGDVLEKPDGTAYGDGVNIAARLQALADPGGVLASDAIHSAVKGRLAVSGQDLGERRLKNIAGPVRVYALRAGARRSRRYHRWVAAVAAAVAIAVGGVWLASQDRAQTESERPVVAVLPFANLGGDRARDYYSDGITGDIIGALGRFPGLLVISHNAVRGYGDRPLPEVRKELNARYIVQGSLREAGGKLRASVELSDAEKGVLLWSERYEGEGSEVFAIQDRIVSNIVSSLQSRLALVEQQRALSRPTENLEAYDLVLRARSLLERETRRENREARELLEHALELDPEYMDILVALGEAEVQRALYGWIQDPRDAMRRAEERARRVLASPDVRAHASACVLLARIYSNLGRAEEALEAAERAIALNASDARALFQRGSMLLYIGRIDEAIKGLEAAKRFEPRPTLFWLNLAVAYYVAGRYEDALALADVLATRFPDDVYLHANRAAALGQLGRLDEARAAASRVRALSPLFQVENVGMRFASAQHTAKLQEGLRKAGL